MRFQINPKCGYRRRDPSGSVIPINAPFRGSFYFGRCFAAFGSGKRWKPGSPAFAETYRPISVLLAAQAVEG